MRRNVNVAILGALVLQAACSVPVVQGGPRGIYLLPPQATIVRVKNVCSPLADIATVREGTVVENLPFGNDERLTLARAQPFGTTEIPITITFKSEDGHVLGTETYRFDIEPYGIGEKMWVLSSRSNRRGWGGCRSEVSFLYALEGVVVTE